MDLLRKVDFERIAGMENRGHQMLLDRASGATTCKIMISKLFPGDGSPRGVHTHTFDQIFYVLTGDLSVEIGGGTYVASPGTLVINPAGVPHRNFIPLDGAGPATFLEFMAPLPAPNETRESADSYVDPKTNTWVTPAKR